MLGEFAKLTTLVALVSACRAPVAPVLEAPGSSRGTVLVENEAAGNDYFNLVKAKFWHQLDDDCERSTESGCEVTSCAQADLMPADSSIGLVSVGALTLSGFTFLKQDGLTLEGPPYFSSSPRPARMWSGGEPIVVSAPGSELPGFNGRVIAPFPITATIAGCATQSECTVERSTPLELRWSPAEVGEVLVSLTLNEDLVTADGPWPLRMLTQARCRFASGSRGANLEPALLGLFRSSGASPYLSGSLEIARRSTGFASLDGGSVTIDVDWVAVRQSVIFQ